MRALLRRAAAPALLLLAAAPLRAQHHAEPLGGGAVGLDVYAQGTIVDVLVASRSGDTTALLHQRSRDGGKTWSVPVAVPLGGAVHTPHRGADPQIAAAGDRVVVLWTRPRTSKFGSGPLAIAGSDDGGATWTRLGVAGAFNWRFQGCPHVGGGLAATGDGQLHALAWTGEDERAGLYALSSADGGRRWGPARRVGGERAHHADLAASGGLLAATWDEPEANGRAVLAAFSYDGGRTFSPARRLSDAGWTASFPLVASTGKGFVAFWTESQADGPARWRSQALDTKTPRR